MKLPQLNNREQCLLGFTISVMVLGVYLGLRFVPANRVIADLTQSMEATEKRLLATTIPDEPVEDMAKLNALIDEHERVMASIKSQAEMLERRLAPSDSRDLIVNISQLARTSHLQIKVNEAWKTQWQAPAQQQPAKAKDNKNKKAAAKPAESSPMPVILPASAGWIARMSPQTAFSRPMQRLELEGSYQALRQFIHGMEELPYQVTVLRLTVEKVPIQPPSGYPQPLLAELVLAL